MRLTHIYRSIHLRFLYLTGWRPRNMALFHLRLRGMWPKRESTPSETYCFWR